MIQRLRKYTTVINNYALQIFGRDKLSSRVEKTGEQKKINIAIYR